MSDIEKKSMNKADFPDGIKEFLKPRVRLFLSADLVGSTALKQSAQMASYEVNDVNGQTGPKWFTEIANFYHTIQRTFDEEIARFSSRLHEDVTWPSCPQPELWKCNGDELIFAAEIKSERDLFSIIFCWRESIRGYRDFLRTKGELKLDVKASAWIAGFPLSNTEVVFAPLSAIPEELESGEPTLFHYYFLNALYSGDLDKTSMTRDYIGPAIDTGFRLAGKASPRKLTISLEAALLLATVRPPDGVSRSIRFYFDGTTELKGVLGGRPYPIIWIDMFDEDQLYELEDKFLHRKSLSRDDIELYCSEFIKSNAGIMAYPFLLGAYEPELKRVPERYKKALTSHQEKWLREIEKFDNELRATREDRPDENSDEPERELDPTQVEKLLDQLPDRSE